MNVAPSNATAPGSSRSSRRLVVLPVSPWSERARWALDHHQLGYETVEHVPFLGEPRLRRIVGPGKKTPTVPVLITPETTLVESWDIALHADREGSGSKLILPGREQEVRTWNDLADETMAVARALIVAALLASPEAIDEGLPPSMPRFIRPILRPIGSYGMKWFGRKYGVSLTEADAHRAKVRHTLTVLRKAIADSPYLLGTFSYADIVMATLLQGVSPVDSRYIRLGPASRKVWTQPDLAAEFADLVAWRDRLYEEHRGTRAPRAAR